jgi:hypothetical protein
VSTHTIFCAKQALSSRDAWCLNALLNSLVANFLVRLQMSTHVTATLMARLPVPRPPHESAECRELAALASAMSRLPTPEDDLDRYVRLNVIAARLYGLRADELAAVASTFPRLPGPLVRGVVERYGT